MDVIVKRAEQAYEDYLQKQLSDLKYASAMQGDNLDCSKDLKTISDSFDVFLAKYVNKIIDDASRDLGNYVTRQVPRTFRR